MPAHIKSSMFGCALTYVFATFLFLPFHFSSTLSKKIISCILALNFFRIPITDGHLNLGTWQVRKNIYTCSRIDHLLLSGHFSLCSLVYYHGCFVVPFQSLILSLLLDIPRA